MFLTNLFLTKSIHTSNYFCIIHYTNTQNNIYKTYSSNFMYIYLCRVTHKRWDCTELLKYADIKVKSLQGIFYDFVKTEKTWKLQEIKNIVNFIQSSLKSHPLRLSSCIQVWNYSSFVVILLYTGVKLLIPTRRTIITVNQKHIGTLTCIRLFKQSIWYFTLKNFKTTFARLKTIFIGTVHLFG